MLILLAKEGRYPGTETCSGVIPMAIHPMPGIVLSTLIKGKVDHLDNRNNQPLKFDVHTCSHANLVGMDVFNIAPTFTVPRFPALAGPAFATS